MMAESITNNTRFPSSLLPKHLNRPLLSFPVELRPFAESMIGSSESKLQNINQILIPSDPLIPLPSHSPQLSNYINLILERFAQIQKKIIQFYSRILLHSSLFLRPKHPPSVKPQSQLLFRALIWLLSLGENSSVLMVESIQMQSQYIRIIIYCQSIMSCLLPLAMLLLMLASPVVGHFCAASCIDYKGPCFNETPAGCMVCANSIFNMNANWSSSTPCSLAPQRTIVANELPNTPSMALTGFTSSSPTPVTCTNYTFSGRYASNDYLFKNYTGIPLNHYAVVVRFGVGYVGAWTDADFLRLNLVDQNGATNFDYRYYCGTGSLDVNNNTLYNDLAENINGQTGTPTDCVRVKEYTLTHNTSFLAVNFSALTTQTDPNVAFWGIKQLMIATKDCHSYCLTCFGGLNSQCLSCAVGYYLQGNVCLPVCDSNLYVVVDSRTCVSQCPAKYFATTNATMKVCANCQIGCAMCSDANTCLAWDGQQAYVPNLWRDKMEFWILLILVLCGLIGYVIYRMVRKALPSELEEGMMTKSDDKDEKDKQREKEKEVQDVRISNIQADTIPLPNDSLSDSLGPTIDMKGDTLWFNQLVEMEPVEVKIRGRKRRPKEDPLSVNSFDANSNVDL